MAADAQEVRARLGQKSKLLAAKKVALINARTRLPVQDQALVDILIKDVELAILHIRFHLGQSDSDELAQTSIKAPSIPAPAPLPVVEEPQEPETDPLDAAIENARSAYQAMLTDESMENLQACALALEALRQAWLDAKKRNQDRLSITLNTKAVNDMNIVFDIARVEKTIEEVNARIAALFIGEETPVVSVPLVNMLI